MNYLPYAGYWFYGAANSGQRAAFQCSWGLIAVAAIEGGISLVIFQTIQLFRRH